MDLTELRTGNVIKKGYGDYLVFDYYDKDLLQVIFQNETETLKPSEVFPAPINMEMLTLCSFDPCFRIKFNNKIGVWSVFFTKKSKTMEIADVSFLHELQNIHKSLTKKEAKIWI